MTEWRNWGDHPVVVSIGIVASLAGIVGLVLTMTGAFSQGGEDTVASARSLTAARPDPEAGKATGASTSTPAGSTTKVEVVAHDVSLREWNERRSALRMRDGLRQLSALESARRESSMPTGTYGHVSPPKIKVEGDWKYLGSVDRFAPTSDDDWSFEVHRRHDGVLVLLGFVSEAPAATIASGAGKVDEFVLSPIPAAGLTSLITLPLDRIKTADARAAQLTPDQDLWVLDVTLK